MRTFLLIVIGLAALIGILAPSDEPVAPAAKAAPAQQGGLFDPAEYKETKLRRRANGHFYVTAHVNGAPVEFVVDTGATSVALTEADARAAGLEFSSAEFVPVARTANGIARGKIVTLPKVAIEGKEVMEVDGAIVEGAEQSLLGQAYLARITAVEMNGDHMVLR